MVTAEQNEEPNLDYVRNVAKVNWPMQAGEHSIRNFSIDQQDFILKESWQFDWNFIDVMAALELTELK